MDNTALSWSTGGRVGWFGQTSTYYYGSDAAQSGTISHNYDSWIQTTVTGPGTLKFCWKVSSEAGWDFLYFYIDGVIKEGISGNSDWQQKSYGISSGSHTVKWRYMKDGSVNSEPDWRLFSYDNDEGEWEIHGTTSATTYNDYNIQVIGPHSGGWKYGIWINGAWQRYGHLPYEKNDVNQANEVWSYTGIYTPDTIAAYHKEPRLYVGYNQLIWWNEEVSTKWWRNFWPPWPVKESHWMGTNAWIYKTWVE